MARSFGVLRVFLLVSFLLAGAAIQAAGNELAGTYRVEQVTDLGSAMRVTLHIHLVNNTFQDLTVTQVSLRDLRQQGKAEAVAWGTRLQPREGTTVEHDFVISRAEYESWGKGVRPRVQVGFQPAGGREVLRTIQLMPLAARRQP